MNPVIVTYIGFVVAVLVLMWGAIEIMRRYGRGNEGKRKGKIHAQTMNTWVPLKPTTTAVDMVGDPITGMQESSEEDAEHELHTRAQQNGHFSESKKNL